MKTYDKKTVRGWALYDWANSVYPLVITTAIFPIFYEAVTSQKTEAGELISDVVQLFGYSFINTELYTYVIATSFLIVSIISPLLSGIADVYGNKKRFLQFFCYLGAGACASLYFFDVAYLGAWNFRTEIMNKETSYLSRGGEFITHVPQVMMFS